jgi:chromosome segregation ATPase
VQELSLMSKLSESLDALNERIAAFEPDLEKKRETIEKAIRELAQLKADVQTEEARLKAVREQRTTEQVEFDEQVGAHKREMAAMEWAKAEIGVDLKAWQVQISAAELQAQTLEAQNNMLRGQHDQILASINSLRRQHEGTVFPRAPLGG